jgi:hypothetical protein
VSYLDLIVFLTARYDEREAEANEIHRPGVCGSVDHDGEFDPDPIYCSCGYPACVLREVEAKRKRLALFTAALKKVTAALKKAPPEDDPATAHSYVRERINVNQASGRFVALEMSVRLDAMVYSDHPEFKQEWLPAGVEDIRPAETET